jgi:glutaredoxin
MIKIYGTNSCGACQKARYLCKQYRVEFKYYDCSIRKYYLESLEGGADITKLPQVFVDDNYIGDLSGLVKYLQEDRYGSKE